MQKLTDWFYGLQPRERVIIVAGGILLVVVAIYVLALAPFYKSVAQRSVRVEQKSGDLAWMQSVAGELMTLSANQPATVAPSGESLVVLIDRTAHECGLGSSLTGQTPDGETAIRVRLEGADFDKMLACLATLQQVHAVTIQSATFDRAGKPGLINASLILNRAGG